MTDEDSAKNNVENKPQKRFLTWKRSGLLLALVVAIILIILYGVPYYIYARDHASTDDAFIEGNIVPISPRVSGHVKKVYVVDNQWVEKGDLLIELQDSTYKAKLDAAKANLAAAKSSQMAAKINTALTKISSKAQVDIAQANVQQAKAGVDTAKARLQTSKSDLNKAKAQVDAAKAQADSDLGDLKRYKTLQSTGTITPQKLSHVKAKYKTSKAQVAAKKAGLTAAKDLQTQDKALLKQAEAKLVEAKANLDKAKSAPKQIELSVSKERVRQSQLGEAKANLKQAKLNLSYTKIYAPKSGSITKKSVEPGQYLVPGQLTMSIVPKRVWVKANYKETQLANIHVGQKVTIDIDAYPEHNFTGVVQSIMAGTGSRFSLLPPENATGNYIKVVQRVAVKIVFKPAPDFNKYHIAPGMSVVPYIDISKSKESP